MNGRSPTVFRLASVSRPIVSTAALVLVAQGRLDLDECIEHWLPEFKPRLADGSPARITLYEGMSGRFVTDLHDAIHGAMEMR